MLPIGIVPLLGLQGLCQEPNRLLTLAESKIVECQCQMYTYRRVMALVVRVAQQLLELGPLPCTEVAIVAGL